MCGSTHPAPLYWRRRESILTGPGTSPRPLLCPGPEVGGTGTHQTPLPPPHPPHPHPPPAMAHTREAATPPPQPLRSSARRLQRLLQRRNLGRRLGRLGVGTLGHRHRRLRLLRRRLHLRLDGLQGGREEGSWMVRISLNSSPSRPATSAGNGQAPPLLPMWAHLGCNLGCFRPHLHISTPPRALMTAAPLALEAFAAAAAALSAASAPLAAAFLARCAASSCLDATDACSQPRLVKRRCSQSPPLPPGPVAVPCPNRPWRPPPRSPSLPCRPPDISSDLG